MYLGLDLGTSGLRGIVTLDGVNVLAEAEESVSTSNPHPGWSEQSPADWVAACEAVMQKLREENAEVFAQIKGIGISGHMHGATLLDSDGKVLRPCIMWNDTRSASEAEALDQQDKMRDVSGNIVFPGFTAPKLAWVKTNEPEIFEKVAKVLLPKDYLRYWLTGQFISEMSDSAGTSWMDVGTRDWSVEALELGGMDAAQMPKLVEGSAPGGTVRDTLCKEWGLSGSVLVAGGAGDNAAAACGIGCLNEGQGFLSLGTSGVLLLAREDYAPAPETAVHTFCHAIPDRWVQMGVMLSATNSLNWLSRNLGHPPAELAAALPEQISGPSKVTFLPYLSGERTPHNDSDIRGALLGVDVAANPVDLTQAVMEGVAFALRDNLEALRATGAQLETLVAVGGGTRSRFWLETLATVLNVPLSLPGGSELGAAIGAARLAICAVTERAPSDVMAPPEIAEVIAPNPALTEAYEAAYQQFRQYYTALAPLAKA